jgi:HPr kinase/phosphorylase
VPEGATIHASAVLVGARAVLIRGPSGSGKSRLARDLLQAAARGALRFARLVADDRVHARPVHGRLLVRPPQALAGLIEIRGLGVMTLPHEPVAVVGQVVDLADPEAQRLPQPAARTATIEGIALPRLGVALGHDPFPLVLAALTCGSGAG